jgi:WD40 repeat protein
MKDYDRVVIGEYDDDINALLVYVSVSSLPFDDTLTPTKAGIFSAILTAFIIELQKDLKKDYTEISSVLIRRISMQLEGSRVDPLAPPNDPFTPSWTIVAVNILWFSSLLLSLFAALLGILAKQWFHVYDRWSEGTPYENMLFLRHFYRMCFEEWHVADIVGTLPVLLQLALLLFVVGVVAYLWALNYVIAGIISSLAFVMAIVVAIVIILPAFRIDCPFKSPPGLFIAALINRFEVKTTRILAGWRKRDIENAYERQNLDAVGYILWKISFFLESPETMVNQTLAEQELHKSLTPSRISELDQDEFNFLLETIIVPAISPRTAPDRFWPGTNNAHDLYQLLAQLDHLSDTSAKGVADTLVGITNAYNPLYVSPLITADVAIAVCTWSQTTNANKSPAVVAFSLIVLNMAIATFFKSGQPGSGHSPEVNEKYTHNELLYFLQNRIDLAEQIGLSHALVKNSEGVMKKYYPEFTSKKIITIDRSCSHPSVPNGSTTSQLNHCIVIFSLSGACIATTDENSVIRIWSSVTGENIARLNEDKHTVRLIAFAPDGKGLVSVFNDYEPLVWDILTGHIIKSLDRGIDPYTKIEFSPDGSTIVAVDTHGRIGLYDARPGKSAKAYYLAYKNCASFVFSPDGSHLAIGKKNGCISISDTKSGNFTLSLSPKDPKEIISLTYSPDGKQLASGLNDFRVILWDVDAREELNTHHHQHLPHHLQFSRKASRIIINQTRSASELFVWNYTPSHIFDESAISDSDRDLLISTGTDSNKRSNLITAGSSHSRQRIIYGDSDEHDACTKESIICSNIAHSDTKVAFCTSEGRLTIVHAISS